LGAEPPERVGLLFDVDLDRDKRPVDEVRDLRIGVNLGIQPSAPRSHRRGAEIE